MNRILALKILSASAVLVLLGGCDRANAPEEKQPAAKVAANEIPGCPKYQTFITNFANDILDCAQSDDIGECVPDLLDVFGPVYTCLDLEMPAEDDLTSFNDLIGMSTEIGNAVEEFDNDASKAEAFVGCLCGGSSSGGGGVGGSVGFNAGTSSAGSSGFSAGTSSAGSSGFSAGTSSAGSSGFSAGTSSAGSSGFSASSSGN